MNGVFSSHVYLGRHDDTRRFLRGAAAVPKRSVTAERRECDGAKDRTCAGRTCTQPSGALAPSARPRALRTAAQRSCAARGTCPTRAPTYCAMHFGAALPPRTARSRPRTPGSLHDRAGCAPRAPRSPAGTAAARRCGGRGRRRTPHARDRPRSSPRGALVARYFRAPRPARTVLYASCTPDRAPSPACLSRRSMPWWPRRSRRAPLSGRARAARR